MNGLESKCIHLSQQIQLSRMGWGVFRLALWKRRLLLIRDTQELFVELMTDLSWKVNKP